MSACIAIPFTPWPPEKLTAIIDKCVQHSPWFHDHLDTEALKRQAVIAYLVDANSNGKLWEVWRDDENVGILMLNQMVPFLDARAHFLFFDSKLSDKEALCRKLLAYAFDQIPLEVVRVEIPTYAKALLKYARKLGFRFESEQRSYTWPTNAAPLSADVAKLGSRKHHATLYNGEWCDVLLLSQTRDEFFASHKEHHGRPQHHQNPEQHDGAAAVTDRT